MVRPLDKTPGCDSGGGGTNTTTWTAMLQPRTPLWKALGLRASKIYWNFVYYLAIVYEYHRKEGDMVRQQSGIFESLTISSLYHVIFTVSPKAILIPHTKRGGRERNYKNPPLSLNLGERKTVFRENSQQKCSPGGEKPGNKSSQGSGIAQSQWETGDIAGLRIRTMKPDKEFAISKMPDTGQWLLRRSPAWPRSKHQNLAVLSVAHKPGAAALASFSFISCNTVHQALNGPTC